MDSNIEALKEGGFSELNSTLNHESAALTPKTKTSQYYTSY